MRPFLPTIQTLQLVTTSVRISLVDSTVRNNLCHPSFDSNVKYESNNITASSSRQYHAGILIFWSTRTVIRKRCLPHKRDRWPAGEWKTVHSLNSCHKFRTRLSTSIKNKIFQTILIGKMIKQTLFLSNLCYKNRSLLI